MCERGSVLSARALVVLNTIVDDDDGGGDIVIISTYTHAKPYIIQMPVYAYMMPNASTVACARSAHAHTHTLTHPHVVVVAVVRGS